VLLFTIGPAFWVGGHVPAAAESSSAFKNTGQCGTIHTAAFRTSEARSEAPI
jgi:hypothetical protein